jgi:hypothetical protein
MRKKKGLPVFLVPANRIWMKPISLTLLFLLTGCASPTVIVSKSYPPTTPESVQILFSKPSRAHEVLAHISAHGILAGSHGGNTKVAISKLKTEAAKIGADAIILSGPPRQQSASFTNYHNTATADIYHQPSYGYGHHDRVDMQGSGYGTTIMGGAGDSTVDGMAIKFK